MQKLELTAKNAKNAEEKKIYETEFFAHTLGKSNCPSPSLRSLRLRPVLICVHLCPSVVKVFFNWMFRLRVIVVLSLLVLPHMLSASEPNSWSLASPDGKCEIIVSLGEDGSLSYQALHERKTVLHKSSG